MRNTSSDEDEERRSPSERNPDQSVDEESSSGLQRRTVLSGFAATGVAGALSATGLYGLDAFLSDRERFGNGGNDESNTLQSGEFDLGLAWKTYYDPADGDRRLVDSAGDCDTGTFVDDDRPAIQLEGIRPGDSGTTEVCLRVRDNPGWLSIEATCPSPGLEKALDATVTYDAGRDGDADEFVLPSSETKTDLSGTLCQVLATLSEGVRLGETCTEPNSTQRLLIEWEFPEPTYNNQYEEYENGTAAFGLRFYATQCRHNPNPASVAGRTCELEPCKEGGPAISWIAFCTEQGTEITAEDISFEILETTAEGTPNKVGWRSNVQLSTVVLGYGTPDGLMIENFDVEDGFATGTATIGEGDERTLDKNDDDQSPQDPAPGDQTAIKYNYDENTGTFEIEQ